MQPHPTTHPANDALIAATALVRRMTIVTHGGSPQAEMYISEYVQNGDAVTGSFNELFGNGISSITVALTVNNATAKGVMTVTTDR